MCSNLHLIVREWWRGVSGHGDCCSLQRNLSSSLPNHPTPFFLFPSPPVCALIPTFSCETGKLRSGTHRSLALDRKGKAASVSEMPRGQDHRAERIWCRGVAIGAASSGRFCGWLVWALPPDCSRRWLGFSGPVTISLLPSLFFFNLTIVLLKNFLFEMEFSSWTCQLHS